MFPLPYGGYLADLRSEFYNFLLTFSPLIYEARDATLSRISDSSLRPLYDYFFTTAE